MLIPLVLMHDQASEDQLQIGMPLPENHNASEGMMQLFLKAVEEAKLGGVPPPSLAARVTAPLHVAANLHKFSSKPRGNAGSLAEELQSLPQAYA